MATDTNTRSDSVGQGDAVLAAAVEMLAARRALEFAPTSRSIDIELARHERAIEALQVAVAKAVAA